MIVAPTGVHTSLRSSATFPGNSVTLGFCPFCPAHKPFSSSALASQPGPNPPFHRPLSTTSLQPHLLQNAFFVSNRHMRPRSPVPSSECRCFLAKSPCLMASTTCGISTSVLTVRRASTMGAEPLASSDAEKLHQWHSGNRCPTHKDAERDQRHR